MKPTAILLFLLFCNTASFGQNILEYTLSKDDIFTIKQDASQVITQELNEAKHELTNTIEGNFQFRVLKEQA